MKIKSLIEDENRKVRKGEIYDIEIYDSHDLFVEFYNECGSKIRLDSGEWAVYRWME